MRQFSLLRYESNDEYISVIDYDVGDFDFTLFWHGERFNEPPPLTLRLYVNSDDIAVDYVGNPLSIPICSTRMTKILHEYEHAAIEVFDAPVFDHVSGKPVLGYKLINLTRRIKCLDLDRSLISYSSEGSDIEAVNKFVLKSRAIPSDVHLFRIDEWHYPVVISSELASKLVNTKMLGMGFTPCKTS